VADGVAGPRFDDHHVAGPGGLWPAIDCDGAFAGGDQQDLFDLVGVFGAASPLVKVLMRTVTAFEPLA
jgi:hypothetical protein